MKKIAVFTSGGDSPGMNACIRAVVRTAAFHNIQTTGILHGYEGMMDAEFVELTRSSVANIINRGGTILKTARSKRFMEAEGRKIALNNLKSAGIDGIVAIGGDGTFTGARVFSEICDISIVGCPGTIDNDLVGTDYTIGYDTAINTVMEAVDKIRDTAESHDRLFFVEVMGRDAGLIALRSGIAVGAEDILIPETRTDLNLLIEKLREGRKTKTSKIIIVAEGDEAGGAFTVADQVKKALPFYDTRVTVLGHIQRGGNPTCMDRVNSSRMGFAAVEALMNGKNGVMIGIVNNNITYTPFENAIKHIQQIYPDYLRMMEILSM
ncbi:MAG: 6-phosphofructokinase [Flavobacteriales bacterium]|nr:6-phosphofructokinase [Flavobacteriales bacterium]